MSHPLFMGSPGRLSFRLRHRDNRHEGLVVALLLESDDTVDEGEQGVILAHSDVLTRIVDGSPLTDEDVAGFAILTTEQFDAQTLAL